MKADLSLYRVFVAVADEGSFVRAAARLFLTQPAVSQAVQRMETRKRGPSCLYAGGAACA